ncbi:MAG: NADH:ubiquinone reductase (Na(+)-transporting) subunit F, partial [Xanthomonadales bacterium]|nr:NADH:ubiquinone reductase (Na(+)-transporting) subunit F [Xanthomonadales bacterium]
MEQSLIGSAFFSGIVLLLVGIVLVARRWLSPGGPAELTINGKACRTTRGRNLLGALGELGVLLPSPCGGRGMCGQCKVVIVGESHDPLPNEMAHLSRREIAAGTCLACVRRIFEDLELKVPEELMRVQKQRCTIASARSVSTFLREITLALPEGEVFEFSAGQYLLLYAPPYELRFSDFDIEPEYREFWQKAGLLTLVSKVQEPVARAYSLANSPGESNAAVLVVRIAVAPPDAPRGTPPGQVSSYIFGLAPGDKVEIAGPFGDFCVRENEREIVLIAGGAGIAPMRSIVLDQLGCRQTRRKISLWYGIRSQQDLCYEEEFDALAARYDNFTWQAAVSELRSNDRWTGARGFIHDVIHTQYLAAHPAPEELEYYLCGPPVMSIAVIH